MFKWLLIIHVLGATIWVGGHLLLCLRYLPEALKKKDSKIIKAFEKKYEIIGMPALLAQVITGIWMAITVYNVQLFGVSTPTETAISVKLILLLITIILALIVRFFIFPKLTNNNLWLIAIPIITVTIISVLYIYYGIIIRFGGS